MTTAAQDEQRPVLWQLQISHYNEKVRWALDYKRIPHRRRSMLPGVHRLITKRLAGIVTSPVLTIEVKGIGDSSAILQAIEERWPEPQLIPDDEMQRRRALQLEDYFDEELGPHIRRAVYHELLPYPELVVPLFTEGATVASKALLRGTFPLLRVGMRQTSTTSHLRAAARRSSPHSRSWRRSSATTSTSSATASRSPTSRRRRCSTRSRCRRSSRTRRPSGRTSRKERASSSASCVPDLAGSGSRRCTAATVCRRWLLQEPEQPRYEVRPK
jgi:hypothetical protein